MLSVYKYTSIININNETWASEICKLTLELRQCLLQSWQNNKTTMTLI